MPIRRDALIAISLLLGMGCRSSAPVTAGAPVAERSKQATVARIYFWRARPGRMDEYTRYVRDSAEAIDREAQRRGAFISIETVVASDTSLPWTHMRIFRLRDSAQLAGLGRALDEAGVALQPDSARRAARSLYGASLRDRVGDVTIDLADGELPYVPMPGFGGASVREGWIGGAGGVRLFYRLVGTGNDTVVFVHGGPATGMREGYDFERLVGFGHALLSYDQRGAGLSELVSDSARLGVSEHAADLDAVVRHFGLGRAKVIGLSWGAAVVARWAADHPDEVGRLVFVSPISPTAALIAARFTHLDSIAGHPDAGGLSARLRAAAAPMADSQLRERCRADRVGPQLYRHPGEHSVSPRGDACDYPVPVLRNRVVARAAGIASLGGAAYDLRPTLRRIDAPALVVEGALTNVPLDATREFAASLPNATMALIPDAGHQNWLDRPDLVFPRIDAFLR